MDSDRKLLTFRIGGEEMKRMNVSTENERTIEKENPRQGLQMDVYVFAFEQTNPFVRFLDRFSSRDELFLFRCVSHSLIFEPRSTDFGDISPRVSDILTVGIPSYSFLFTPELGNIFLSSDEYHRRAEHPVIERNRFYTVVQVKPV